MLFNGFLFYFPSSVYDINILPTVLVPPSERPRSLDFAFLTTFPVPLNFLLPDYGSTSIFPRYLLMTPFPTFFLDISFRHIFPPPRVNFLGSPRSLHPVHPGQGHPGQSPPPILPPQQHLPVFAEIFFFFHLKRISNTISYEDKPSAETFQKSVIFRK